MHNHLDGWWFFFFCIYEKCAKVDDFPKDRIAFETQHPVTLPSNILFHRATLPVSNVSAIQITRRGGPPALGSSEAAQTFTGSGH